MAGKTAINWKLEMISVSARLETQFGEGKGKIRRRNERKKIAEKTSARGFQS